MLHAFVNWHVLKNKWFFILFAVALVLYNILLREESILIKYFPDFTKAFKHYLLDHLPAASYGTNYQWSFPVLFFIFPHQLRQANAQYLNLLLFKDKISQWKV